MTNDFSEQELSLFDDEEVCGQSVPKEPQAVREWLRDAAKVKGMRKAIIWLSWAGKKKP